MVRRMDRGDPEYDSPAGNGAAAAGIGCAAHGEPADVIIGVATGVPAGLLAIAVPHNVRRGVKHRAVGCDSTYMTPFMAAVFRTWCNLKSRH